MAGALANVRIVRIAAGFQHSIALANDGRVFAFGTDGGVPAAGAGGDGFEWECWACVTTNAADAAACSHVFVGDDDYGDGPCEGRRPSRQLSPCLLQGAHGSSGCYASHSAFVPGAPPRAPGFDAPLTFAMQKPAAKEPHPKAVAAVAAMAAAKQHAGGGAAAVSSAPSAAAAAAAAGGTKRKRNDDDDDEEEEDEEEDEEDEGEKWGGEDVGAEDAEPLC